jgi:hypothetical protein
VAIDMSPQQMPQPQAQVQAMAIASETVTANPLLSNASPQMTQGGLCSGERVQAAEWRNGEVAEWAYVPPSMLFAQAALQMHMSEHKAHRVRTTQGTDFMTWVQK